MKDFPFSKYFLTYLYFFQISGNKLEKTDKLNESRSIQPDKSNILSVGVRYSNLTNIRTRYRRGKLVIFVCVTIADFLTEAEMPSRYYLKI